MRINALFFKNKIYFLIFGVQGLGFILLKQAGRFRGGAVYASSLLYRWSFFLFIVDYGHDRLRAEQPFGKMGKE